MFTVSPFPDKRIHKFTKPLIDLQEKLYLINSLNVGVKVIDILTNCIRQDAMGCYGILI